jgi:hypothetical protein
MREGMIMIRVPHEARTRLRAIAAVTGLSLQQVVVAAFDAYYARLPKALRREVEQILATPKGAHE